MVTLTGPGGVGKTRLAVEAARELSGTFNDGAFVVSLAATGAADMSAALAQSLDATEQAGESPLEALQRRPSVSPSSPAAPPSTRSRASSPRPRTRSSSSPRFTLANVHSNLGELETAAELYEEAATHADRAGARPALAGIMNNLGYLSLLRDEPDAASATSREAAGLFEELGFGEEEAGAWLNVAAAELSLGRLDEARSALTRSLDGYVAVGHAEGVSYCLDIAATIAVRLGDKRRAALLIGAAAAARERTGGKLPPVEERLHDQTPALLDGLDAARAEGASLEPDAAVALARV